MAFYRYIIYKVYYADWQQYILHWDTHHNTTMLLFSLGKNYIIVRGKNADSAGTDGRITWLQDMYRGHIWHHTIHYFLTTNGYVNRCSIKVKKENDWLILSHLAYRVLVFDTDNDVCRQAQHHITATQCRWHEKAVVFKHSAVFLSFSFSFSSHSFIILQEGLKKKKFIALCKHSVYRHLFTINFTRVLEIEFKKKIN